VVVDNLSRGRIEAVEAVRRIAPDGRYAFVEADLLDEPALRDVLEREHIEAVMHFAALAYVGESVREPLRYYRNNVAGTASLLSAMDAAGVWRIVFSSTCATYGEPEASDIPIAES
jgi:UDP-glucose 4-epimerase